MEKLLRVASDIGGYAPETDPGHKPAGWVGASDDTERFEWVSRWLGLKDPEAEILFGLGKPRYTPSGITREHLLAVLEAIREGALREVGKPRGPNQRSKPARRGR